MNPSLPSDSVPLCPSAQPEMEGSVVFGVVQGTVEEPRVIHLVEPLPVTVELLALSGPVKPTEIFRFAATCAQSACVHFDGVKCGLAQRTVQHVPAVIDVLPTCRIRPSCRWWQQEGKAACLRCPGIVTENLHPSDVIALAALPPEGGE